MIGTGIIAGCHLEAIAAHTPCRGYPSIPEEYTTLYLTKGAICIRPFVSVCKTTGGEYDPVDFSGYPGMFEAQMEDFVTAMDTGRVLYYTGAEGKRYVEVIASIW